MTPTAKELWNDQAFLIKRGREQTEYMRDCLDKMVKANKNGTNTPEYHARQMELFLSASNLQYQFMERLWQINLQKMELV